MNQKKISQTFAEALDELVNHPDMIGAGETWEDQRDRVIETCDEAALAEFLSWFGGAIDG